LLGSWRALRQSRFAGLPAGLIPIAGGQPPSHGAAMLNKILLIGFLGRAPELKRIERGAEQESAYA
jgi:hypothetical protein